jgi:hypothetical protein
MARAPAGEWGMVGRVGNGGKKWGEVEVSDNYLIFE